MIPRADRILMGGTGAEDGRELKDGVLYSDRIYEEGRIRRRVVASIYTDGDRASRIRLKAEGYEDIDYPMSGFYTYKEQELDSYNYVPYLPRTTSIFYSSFMFEWHVPKKTSWLKIESSLASVKTLARLFHLGFRRRVDEYSSEYMSTRGLHVLV